MTIHVPPGRGDPALRRFSAEDLRRMIGAGILDEDERVELLDGELVERAAKGYAHDLVKNRLARRFSSILPESLYLATESTLQLAPDTLVEPDLLVAPETAHRPAPSGFCAIPGPEILLVIEVAASSLAYDLGRKARLYARSGIAESWVIAAQERQARVHRGPRGEAGYAEIRDHGPDSVLVPRADLLAGVTVPLADLV
ncbi:protein of unknown function DUF820 [Methylobacterium sp. 4-46]|uniref:Uma2 family endonuclease n=1 Tax=unclassified Methylobacterium TaxID=2615210 RepID=UPI000165C702|nr:MULTISPECIES: Uma2 family endonuclease [Methylobacterium]ACA17456.1 protein of unknown function DUF820 [Methylobacterium sp. 4-46]WFT83141.1 Uma2 family endonuclease [Methylobacterium nodulans]